MIVFDLGGVIVRICRSWEEGCRAAGVHLSPAWDDPAARERRRELNSLHQRGLMHSDDFYAAVAASVPGVYSADDIRRVHHAWTLDEYPGVAALVDDLHAADVITGVLSNTNHAHWLRLAPAPHLPAPEYPTPRRLRHVHASHLLGLAKPDQAIYHEFARRAGFLPGEPGTGRGSQILFFDDLLENIDAARRAGWLGVQVDHAGDTAAQMRAVLREFRVLT